MELQDALKTVVNHHLKINRISDIELNEDKLLIHVVGNAVHSKVVDRLNEFLNGIPTWFCAGISEGRTEIQICFSEKNWAAKNQARIKEEARFLADYF